MFVRLTSADKVSVKKIDSFQQNAYDLERQNLRQKAQRGQGPITFTQFKRFNKEDIAISECCRGQNTSIYIRKQLNQHSEVNHEDKLKVEDKPNEKIFNNNAMSETLQTKKFGGGVTHHIGSIRPRRGAQLSWRSEGKFHVNVYTLRM